jgi:16S rRNA processing protein RimM
VKIGRIVGAHGIKGAIRIFPLTDYPERFLGMRTLNVERNGRPDAVLEVQNISSHEGKGQFLVRVAGIDDRDAANALKGCFVTVARDERVELPEGEYWVDSIIGLTVIDDASGDIMGRVEDVMSTGGNDVYLIRSDDGSAKMLPAIGEVVKKIDIDAGFMRINPMEGLWD